MCQAELVNASDRLSGKKNCCKT